MMQSNIFAKVAPLLRELKFESYSSRIEDFLKYYHSGDWIYPAALHRETGLGIKEVYALLERCASIGIVAQALEIYCPHCQRFIGKKYNTIFDIPETVNCVHCDEEIEHPLEHAIVIYKVL